MAHLHRLQAIERARARGASLSLIAAHLAAGKPLDDDTLIEWRSAPAPDDQHPPEFAGPPRRQDIAPLIDGSGTPRGHRSRAQVEDLVAAGVVRREGPALLAARELGVNLALLQSQGLPVETALAVAHRALRAAGPVADAVRAALSAVDGVAPGPLVELACYVFREIVRPAAGED